MTADGPTTPASTLPTLGEHDVRLLLREAAASFPVPRTGADDVLAASRQAPPAVPLHRRRWAQAVTAAAGVSAALVLGVAVLGGSPAAPPAAAPPAPPAAAPPASPAEKALGDAESGTSDRQLTGARSLAPAAQPPDATNFGVAKGGAAPVAAPAPDASLGRVVKTGEVSLIAEDGAVSRTLDAVQRAARRQGGIVAGSATDEAGATPSGTITVRVPVTTFEALVLEVRGLGAVRTASITAKDVTGQYADTEAQIRTLTAARERFLRILTRADAVGEILAVQQRVDDVTGRIDRLQGARKVLAAQSDLSTLAVTVTQADDPAAAVVAPGTPEAGLSGALGDARDGFVSGVEGLIAGSGRALLVLLCLAAVAAAARLAWRTGRRRLGLTRPPVHQRR